MGDGSIFTSYFVTLLSEISIFSNLKVNEFYFRCCSLITEYDAKDAICYQERYLTTILYVVEN